MLLHPAINFLSLFLVARWVFKCFSVFVGALEDNWERPYGKSSEELLTICHLKKNLSVIGFFKKKKNSHFVMKLSQPRRMFTLKNNGSLKSCSSLNYFIISSIPSDNEQWIPLLTKPNN